jgi:hypothetical protein
MRLYASLISALALLSIVSAEPCHADDDTHKGVTAKWVVINKNYTVAGTVRILDGCSFTVEDFTLLPAAINTYIYGSPSTNSKIGFRINSDAVGAYNGGSPIFNLTGENGLKQSTTMHSWKEINALKIFSELDNTLIARTQLAEGEASVKSTSDATMIADYSAIFIVLSSICSLIIAV